MIDEALKLLEVEEFIEQNMELEKESAYAEILAFVDRLCASYKKSAI